MRKHLVPYCLALLLGLAATAQAQQGLTKIADNVYSYVDVKNSSPQNSYAANAGIVIGENGVLAVDSLISAKEARRFIADIRKVTDKPIKFLVNTHYHLDHALGNSEFRKLGAVIIIQELDAKNLAERGPATMAGGAAKYGLSEEDMAGTVLALPDVTFSDRMTVDLGGIVVELVYPGPSHTTGSIFVNVPARKVAFAGDALFTDFHPFLAEGDFPSWAKALDTLTALGAQTIIPGHGPASSAKDVADMKAYLVLFDAKAKELAAKGGDAESIAAELLKVLPHKSQGDMLVAANVAMRYLPKK
jgi:cyclase